MGAHTAKKLGVEVRPSSFKAVATASGRSEAIVGSVTFELQLDATAAPFPVTAHVLNHFISDAQVILGQNFMKSHQVVMAFDPVRVSLVPPSGGDRLTISEQWASRVAPTQPGGTTLGEPSDSLPGQISEACALRLLRRGAPRAFIALVKPYLLSEPTDPVALGSVLSNSAADADADDSALHSVPVSVQAPPKPPAIGSDFPEHYRVELQALLDSFPDVFSESPDGGGAAVDVPEHLIELLPGKKPPYRRNYRLSPLELETLRKQVTDFLARGLISPSTSPFGAPVLFVPKPDGSVRWCMNFTALNAITTPLRYPLNRVDDLLDSARGARVWGLVDLASGYHQIKIAEADMPKTAFSTPFGHFEWRVLPMGLCNAPATFQKAMNHVFKDLPFVSTYLDDARISSSSPEEHLVHVRAVLETLRRHKLKAKLSKCKFLQRTMKYLGHILSPEGISPDPDKVKTLLDWEFPSTTKGLLRFLGLGNYFRKLSRTSRALRRLCTGSLRRAFTLLS
jgi:hypothetical protein